MKCKKRVRLHDLSVDLYRYLVLLSLTSTVAHFPTLLMQ